MNDRKFGQSWSRRILRATGVSALVVAAWASSASAQLVNGDFTSFVAGSAATNTWSQLGVANGGVTPQLTGWTLTTPALPGFTSVPGIECVMLSSAPTGHSTAGGGATPMCGTSYGAPAAGTPVQGGAGNVPADQPSWATLWATPAGAIPGYHGNVIAADGDGPTFADSIQQTFTGANSLVAGATYALSFWQAAGQQVGWGGDLTDWWTVTTSGTTTNSSSHGTTTPLTAGTCTKGCMAVPSEGGNSLGWNQETILFTALGGGNDVIKFLASSNDVGSNEPPILLLANVTLTRVPEPASLALLGVGIAGLAGFRRRKLTAA